MNSKDTVAQAMALEHPSRIPVMCQLANGHTVLNTGVHPIDYWTDSLLWADCLMQMRSTYDFDGILCHKPGRVRGVMDLVERADYDAETPTLYMNDGARIECTHKKGFGADDEIEIRTVGNCILEQEKGYEIEGAVFAAS